MARTKAKAPAKKPASPKKKPARKRSAQPADYAKRVMEPNQRGRSGYATRALK